MSSFNEIPETQNKSNKGIIIVLAITTILFAALAIFFYLQMNDQSTKVEVLTNSLDTKTSEVDTKTKELESLGQDLQRIKEEREKLGLTNDSLDSKIEQLNYQIRDIRKRGQIDASKRKELEKLVAQLREEIIAKDQEIVALKSTNDSLTTNLSSVSAERGRLGDSLSTKLKELEYASILKADDIKVTALTDKGKELDKEEYKAKQIDKLKIAFKIADNKAAKKNEKTFYVRLIQPSGVAFSDEVNGGGTLKTADGQDVLYTFSQKLVFDNTRQLVNVVMPKGFNYVPGAYLIEVYSEGYKIGDGGFKVKESKLF